MPFAWANPAAWGPRPLDAWLVKRCYQHNLKIATKSTRRYAQGREVKLLQRMGAKSTRIFGDAATARTERNIAFGWLVGREIGSFTELSFDELLAVEVVIGKDNAFEGGIPTYLHEEWRACLIAAGQLELPMEDKK